MRTEGQAATRERSWFAIDGALEPIDYDGISFVRFPEAFAAHVLRRYSRPGEWVLDPFCGFGTALLVAERLGRRAYGFEADERRAAFAAARLGAPSHVVHGRAEDIAPGSWPACALLFTSPPYQSFRFAGYDDDPDTYCADAQRIFARLRRFLVPGATLAVEISQLRQNGTTRPRVWQLGTALSELFDLREDLVRVNTGPTHAGPGYDHSHVLVFRSPG